MPKFIKIALASIALILLSTNTVAAVGQPGNVHVDISASPTSVVSGGTTTITWTTQNAVSCDAEGLWSGPEPTSGSIVSAPLYQSGDFVLSCVAKNGRWNFGSVSVTVN